MTKEEKVAYWLDIADYDYDTAEARFLFSAMHLGLSVR